MISLNRIQIIGNIGQDPEIRYLDNGVAVGRFSVATTESYKDADGNWQNKPTDWHNVVVWRYLAERAEKELKKGMAVYVEGQINYLNTHGTSTPVGDVKELGAIQELFGEKSPAISATKAMTGHALGAAGVHEAIYSILMMENNFVAPSINVDNLDEQAKGLDIVTEKRDAELNLVMSNSFGFGGTNATLVMKKYNA